MVDEITKAGGRAVASHQSVDSPEGGRAIVDTALDLGRIVRAAAWARALAGVPTDEDPSAYAAGTDPAAEFAVAARGVVDGLRSGDPDAQSRASSAVHDDAARPAEQHGPGHEDLDHRCGAQLHACAAVVAEARDRQRRSEQQIPHALDRCPDLDAVC
mgnify:CR=1 FL=1